MKNILKIVTIVSAISIAGISESMLTIKKVAESAGNRLILQKTIDNGDKILSTIMFNFIINGSAYIGIKELNKKNTYTGKDLLYELLFHALETISILQSKKLITLLTNTKIKVPFNESDSLIKADIISCALDMMLKKQNITLEKPIMKAVNNTSMASALTVTGTICGLTGISHLVKIFSTPSQQVGTHLLSSLTHMGASAVILIGSRGMIHWCHAPSNGNIEPATYREICIQFMDSVATTTLVDKTDRYVKCLGISALGAAGMHYGIRAITDTKDNQQPPWQNIGKIVCGALLIGTSIITFANLDAVVEVLAPQKEHKYENTLNQLFDNVSSFFSKKLDNHFTTSFGSYIFDNWW